LNAALDNITNRAFPNPSNIAAGSREERALDAMVKSLERLRAGQAMTDVRLPLFTSYDLPQIIDRDRRSHMTDMS
jgi:hypothetical protein